MGVESTYCHEQGKEVITIYDREFFIECYDNEADKRG